MSDDEGRLTEDGMWEYDLDLPDDVYEILAQQAAVQGVTIDEYVVEMIHDYAELILDEATVTIREEEDIADLIEPEAS